MAHFAQLDENNKVINVLVIADSDCGGGNFPESEPIGQVFLESLGLEGTFKQTSFNTYRNYSYVYDDENPSKIVDAIYLGSAHKEGKTPLRGQYAAIGNFYDSEIDEFISE